MKFRNLTKKLHGIGLLELMLSLSIIAILLVMATRYYTVTSAAQKYNEGVQEVMQIQTVIYDWKGTRIDYAGLNTADIANSGLIPDSYIKTPGTISHPWDNDGTGTIDIAPLTTNTSNDTAQLTLNSLQLGPCTQLQNRFKGGPNIVSSICNASASASGTLVIQFK